MLILFNHIFFNLGMQSYWSSGSCGNWTFW